MGLGETTVPYCTVLTCDKYTSNYIFKLLDTDCALFIAPLVVIEQQCEQVNFSVNKIAPNSDKIMAVHFFRTLAFTVLTYQN